MVKYGILFNLLLLTLTAAVCQVGEHELFTPQVANNASYHITNASFTAANLLFSRSNNIPAYLNGKSFIKYNHQTPYSLGRLSENSTQPSLDENIIQNQQLAGIDFLSPGYLNEKLHTAPTKVSRDLQQKRPPREIPGDRVQNKKHTPAILAGSLRSLLIQSSKHALINNIEQANPVSKPVPIIENNTASGYPQWWFAALAVVILAGNLYVVYRYRVYQLAKVTSLRTRISQDLHDNIGSALSSISMFCHAAIQKNDKGFMDDSRRIIELIGETSRDVMKELNETVWLINPVNDNLQMIIQRISNYALPICTTRDIHFEIKLPDSIQTLDLSVEKRKAIYLFLKEAINNCLKYAAAKSLVIHFIKNQKALLVSVKDDGIGFVANNSFDGNGLNNMKQRSKDIKGFIEVKSMIQRGTEIKLQVPLSGVEG